MSNNYQIARGQVLLADLDLPSIFNLLTDPLAPGFPRVELRDEDGGLIQAVIASPGFPPTRYEANLTIPSGIEVVGDYAELTVVWLMQTTTGKSFQVNQNVQVVVPENVREIQQSVLLLDNQTAVSILVEHNLAPGDTASLTIYVNNSPWTTNGAPTAQNIASSSIVARGESTSITFDLTPFKLPARLTPYDCIVSGTSHGLPFATYTSLYYFTPSIMGAMNDLEMTLKKSRAQNVIQSLNYTQADLAGYLNRGLFWFNGLPPILTSFSGLNMQGFLRNAWVLLSTYYGLFAQHLAENDLQFDMSGQTVTLRVDRTGGIDSALGRIESEIDRTIRPMKTLLGKGGVTGGDGSIGDPGGGNLGLGGAMGSVWTGNHSMLNLGMNHGRWPFNLGLPLVR